MHAAIAAKERHPRGEKKSVTSTRPHGINGKVVLTGMDHFPRAMRAISPRRQAFAVAPTHAAIAPRRIVYHTEEDLR